jgi:CheY-like chemotaxis protein
MERVFWVDDEPELTSLVAPKLAQHGFEVLTHSQCRGAVEAAREFRPHLAILDVMLGDGGGYQIARKFRGDLKLCPVPILFLSSLVDEEEIKYALDQGADAYLTKPFNFDQLLQKLNLLEQLRTQIHTRCPDTNLPSLPAMKREIDRRLISREPVALCCVQAVGIGRYAERKGARDEANVRKLIAHCMVDALRLAGASDGYLSQMSHEYYLALVDPGKHEAFANALLTRFRERQQCLYTEVEWLREDLIESGQAQGNHDSIKLCLRISVVHNHDRDFSNAKAMLEALSDTHSVVSRSRGPAVFVDRKRDHRGVLPFERPHVL